MKLGYEVLLQWIALQFTKKREITAQQITASNLQVYTSNWNSSENSKQLEAIYVKRELTCNWPKSKWIAVEKLRYEKNGSSNYSWSKT